MRVATARRRIAGPVILVGVLAGLVACSGSTGSSHDVPAGLDAPSLPLIQAGRALREQWVGVPLPETAPAALEMITSRRVDDGTEVTFQQGSASVTVCAGTLGPDSTCTGSGAKVLRRDGTAVVVLTSGAEAELKAGSGAGSVGQAELTQFWGTVPLVTATPGWVLDLANTTA
jgi:hypothetical protein